MMREVIARWQWRLRMMRQCASVRVRAPPLAKNRFDEYFGIPYSNDMWPRPLMRNNDIIEQPATLETLTARYTGEAVGFIRRARNSPFFLYMPHTYPHVPLAAS